MQLKNEKIHKIEEINEILFTKILTKGSYYLT